MCSTTATGAASSAGNPASSIVRADGPPARHGHHLGDELVAELAQAIAGERGRLGDHVDRPEGERLDAEIGLHARDADDQHARPGPPAERAQHADAVELGHRQVQCDHVGIERCDALEGVAAVTRRGDDVDPAARPQDLGQHDPRERRVIDDEHAWPAAHRAHR
jgi:hypothetical protein